MEPDEKKTVREWLETLNEPERSQALKNTVKSRLNDLEYSTADALNRAFTWSDSPEENSYWSTIHTMLEDKRYVFRKSGKKSSTKISSEDSSTESSRILICK